MIQEYENTLRGLIIDILGTDNYNAYKVSDDRIDNWLSRRDVESKKYNGILREVRLLYYSDFYDLKQIIHKNWELFKPILNNKQRFEVFFAEIERFRDTLAHGRNLTTGQEHLLKGITSDLKNLITYYRNKNENKDDYFIRILKVTDNFGNDLKTIFLPLPVLRVGDEYEVIIEANDPKGRKIEYEVSTWLDKSHLQIIQYSNKFTFTISEAFIGTSFMLHISARTPDSEYKNEDSLFPQFTVLPAILHKSEE